MGAYILRRLLYMIPTVIIISMISFASFYNHFRFIIAIYIIYYKGGVPRPQLNIPS